MARVRSQAKAAAALIQANASPVLTVRVSFGGDNHSDANLAAEVAQHTATGDGCAGIQLIMDALAEAGLADKVTFTTLNVFGRNLNDSKATSRAGRDHYGNHCVAMMIGKNVRSGVFGGVRPVNGGQLGATAIDSATGVSAPSDGEGDIKRLETHLAMARTVGMALELSSETIDAMFNTGIVAKRDVGRRANETAVRALALTRGAPRTKEGKRRRKRVYRRRMEARRFELKQFLRARRAVLAPEEVGLPPGRRRLVPGLRREEVAALAGVGLTWYTWLEQGRSIQPSPELLARIARALRLDPAAEGYLFSLAGLPFGEASIGDLDPALNEMMDLYSAPAFVHDELTDLLAYNALADRLYRLRDRPALDDDDADLGNNLLWQSFMDPARRALYSDYEAAAHQFVAGFRVLSASHVEEARFQRLIDALQRRSADFRRLWNERATNALHAFTIRIQHGEFGELEVRSLRLRLRRAVAVFLVPVGAVTRSAFAR